MSLVSFSVGDPPDVIVVGSVVGEDVNVVVVGVIVVELGVYVVVPEVILIGVVVVVIIVVNIVVLVHLLGLNVMDVYQKIFFNFPFFFWRIFIPGFKKWPNRAAACYKFK